MFQIQATYSKADKNNEVAAITAPGASLTKIGGPTKQLIINGRNFFIIN